MAMRSVFFLAVGIASGTGCLAVHAAPQPITWRQPEAMESKYIFEDASRAALRLDIQPSRGRSRRDSRLDGYYAIECHTPDFTDQEFSWSGDFECRLLPRFIPESQATLFTENPNAKTDWDGSRARFLSREVLGSCAEYPEYGALRHFRVRGMRITLEMSNIRWDDKPRAGDIPMLKSFDFRIEVEPDRTATSSITAPPGFRAPPPLHRGNPSDWRLDCSTVLRSSK